MLIDTCASGGRRNDLETLRRAVPLWRSDFAYEPAAMQLFTYGMAFWIPYFGTAINSVEPYLFRSQMTPAVGVGLESGRIQDGYARFKHLIGQWRQVAGNYGGDYYPLTPYSTASTAWIAWQFDRPEQGEGMVQAFRRPESAYESARFRLRGLDALAKYRVTVLDAPGESEYSGQELAGKGLPVSIRTSPGAVIVVYRRMR
jgi:alpha-galactosidase